MLTKEKTWHGKHVLWVIDQLISYEKKPEACLDPSEVHAHILERHFTVTLRGRMGERGNACL